MNYQLSPTPYFKKKFKKLIKNNFELKSKTTLTFEYMQVNSFLPNLKTHKVNYKVKKGVFSSRVSGDIRIIWEFSETKIQVLDLLYIGGNSGKSKVYK